MLALEEASRVYPQAPRIEANPNFTNFGSRGF